MGKDDEIGKKIVAIMIVIFDSQEYFQSSYYTF